MKIAVTGCNGSVGRRIVACALLQGHDIVGIDHTDPPTSLDASNPRFAYVQADLQDYQTTLQALDGCEGVVHLAAFPNPTDYVAKTHNRFAFDTPRRSHEEDAHHFRSNVVISWNVLRSAAEVLHAPYTY